ncbi:MAG TPA: AraC family transcriptional regulator [Polyangiaceae bacterium]|nr:AraC family transcriptional regulator [Polyangiaceae bacterium]
MAGWSDTGDAGDEREILSFHRAKELSGVEIRSLQNSERAFHVYSTDFEFFVPSTWHGELWHRRRQSRLGPGSILCAHPGEVFSARRVITKGGGNFLTIDARVFQQLLCEHAQHASKLQLRAFSRRSKALDEKLSEVFRVVRPGPSALELQSALVEFVSVVAAELLEEASGETSSLESGLRTAERVRECLHYDSSATVDLSTLAKQAGVSRYQALRLFKRRYGLPPHTYQLSVRVALAQKALREGQQPVHVAAHYGFVDQSHFTRHFKRLLGVTPAQYARAGTRPRATTRPRPDQYLSNPSSERAVCAATGHGSLL